MRNIHLPALAAITLFQSAVAQVPAAFETGVVLNSADLVPAELLRGTCHRVREQVGTDGFLAHFEIDSDFGIFGAIGVPQVRQRVAEIEAIRKLVETSKGDLFADGLKRSIEQPIDAVKNILDDPVNSVKRAPRTVGHFFSKVGGSIERGVSKVADSGGDDGKSPTAAEVGGGIGNAVKNAAGFDKAKLDTAKQLGVDPYSDNIRLQEEMDKVTWAFFAGGLPLRIGAAVASAGVAVVATKMVGIPEETYALTQAELALRDRRSLTEMGVREADIQAFQIQPNLSTTRRLRIVKSLEAMPAAAGRGRIILLANSCATPEQADFLVAALGILESRQLSGAADYKDLHVFGRLPGATSAAGILEVPAPVDHVTWTEQVSAFARRDDLGGAPRVLVHTGSISPSALTGLANSGWKTIAMPYFP